jgi:hypothetical protein
LLQDTNRPAKAEPLYRRALEIDEEIFGKVHTEVARDLSNLGSLFYCTHRLAKSKPLVRRVLRILESSLGPEHPNVAVLMNNLAQLLMATNRLAEGEPLMRRAMEILLRFTRATRHSHPSQKLFADNYEALLLQMGRSEDEIRKTLNEMSSRYGLKLG